MAKRNKNKHKFYQATSKEDNKTITGLTNLMGISSPTQEPTVAKLDNPEHYATVPGIMDQAMIDMPAKTANEIFGKDGSPDFAVSGDDISKMGNSRLTPGITLEVPGPSSHVYHVASPEDRGNHPNRQPRL